MTYKQDISWIKYLSFTFARPKRKESEEKKQNKNVRSNYGYYNK